MLSLAKHVEVSIRVKKTNKEVNRNEEAAEAEEGTDMILAIGAI